jgi:hypothetical protein
VKWRCEHLLSIYVQQCTSSSFVRLFFLGIDKDAETLKLRLPTRHDDNESIAQHQVPFSGDSRHDSPAIGVCGVDEKGMVESKDAKDVR